MTRRKARRADAAAQIAQMARLLNQKREFRRIITRDWNSLSPR